MGRQEAIHMHGRVRTGCTLGSELNDQMQGHRVRFVKCLYMFMDMSTNTLYLVMEPVGGKELQELIKPSGAILSPSLEQALKDRVQLAHCVAQKLQVVALAMSNAANG